MRRLVILLLAVVAATRAYNLVVQEISLTGGLINSNTITCENIANLHIGSQTYNVECYEIMSPTDPKTLEARNLVYKGTQITTKASKIDFLITLNDASTVAFTLSPQMKAGVAQVSPAQDGKWISSASPPPVDPTATTTIASTTSAPPPAMNCKDSANYGKGDCDCKLPQNDGVDFCVCILENTPPDCKKGTSGVSAKLSAKAAKKTVPRVNTGVEADAAYAATVLAEQLPRAIRLRGPGPVLPPIRQSPPEDSVVADEDEERRVKRAAADGTIDDKTVKVTVYYYTLDEPGNPAAVWAAVIEGIILLLLVGACCYFFCWAPRARAAASAAADPYKEEGPNYSVSYANSSFNQRNERIDAFQNPPAPTPAAPPRPANSAYLDDYITDNIGAMSRPGGTAQPPASAAAAAPAFEPRHQRFDSSGLVTVNLS